MEAKKIIINLVGMSCTGKSALKHKLMELIPGAYNVSFDKLKWFLSGYDRVQDADLVRQLVAGYVGVVASYGLTIVLEGAIKTEDHFKRVSEVATQHGYTILTVELQAPQDVLLERFRNRVKEAEEKGNKISVTTEEVFLQNMAEPRYVPENKLVFDSSIRSPEEIAHAIIY